MCVFLKLNMRRVFQPWCDGTAPHGAATSPGASSAPPPVLLYESTRSTPATVWHKKIRGHSVPVVEISGRLPL